MTEPALDLRTRLDIDRLVHRVLLEAGFREPPVDVAVVLRALELDCNFFDLDDPGLLRQLKHKILVGAKRLSDFVERVELKALLLFDDKRVLLDKSLPVLKHPWASAHEAGHQIIPWHREFCRGDTLLTLEPTWHELLEAEANYAASALLFCGEAFTVDARDTYPCFESVRLLQKHYGHTLHATARRYVLHGPEHPMILLVSTPRWRAKPADQAGLVRHLVTSPTFEALFASFDPESLRSIVDERTQERRGGPVGEFDVQIRDKNGEMNIFRAESFYNTHYVITLLARCGNAADDLLQLSQAVSA